MGWKRGCQPFSYHVGKMWRTAERRFVGYVCRLGIYSRHSVWDFQASTPCQKQVPESNSRLHQFCIMLASCPSLRFSTEAEGLVTELWPPRFLTMQWLCSQLCYVTAANQRAIVEIELLATVGWKWGCQPFSCHVPKMWRTAESRCARHVGVRHPFRPFHFGIPSIHSLRAAVGSTSSAISCLHHFDPFVAAARKARLMQRSRVFGNGVAVSKICYNAVIALSVVLCDCCKPKNSCRDWAFSNSGLEVGLPAFQLPMFPKCDSLPKGDLLDMFV